MILLPSQRKPPTLTRCGSRGGRSAFSLLELVMVVVILSILTVLAVPRASKAGKRAQANAVKSTITAVGRAIDHFYAEHGQYPGFDPSSGTPDGTWFVDQLLKLSDERGWVADLPTARYRFGPYLRKPFPTNPFNGLSNVFVRSDRSVQVAAGVSGWIATLSDGSFTINLTEEEITNHGLDIGDPLSGSAKSTQGPTTGSVQEPPQNIGS